MAYKNLLPLILNGFFSIAFFVHIIIIGYSLKHPEHPSVMTYKEDLKNLQFPMTFQFCIQAMEKIFDRYLKVGYNDINQVFSGESRFSKTLYGWNGHTKNQSTLFSSLNGLYCLFSIPVNVAFCLEYFFLLLEMMSNISMNWNSIVKEVGILSTEGKKLTIKGEHIMWPNYFSFPTCQLIHLESLFDLKLHTPLYIWVQFHKHSRTVAFNILDKNKALRKRDLRSQILDYDGSEIQIDDLMSPVYTKIFLDFSHTINLEGDSGINCVNYPNVAFFNYTECDEDFVYRTMKNTFNLMPFWAAKNVEEVTKLK